MKVRTVFMGTPQFAATILESLLQGAYAVIAVYSQVDKPAGRGHRVVDSPVKRLALARRVPIIQPVTFKSSAAMEKLASLQPELIIVAAFGAILPPAVLSLPRFGCLNIHPSLLPRHRGPSPVANTIIRGDETTGVTVMLMDAGLDTGPILAQEELKISLRDTTGSLSAKLADMGAMLLFRTLPKWLGGAISPQAQDGSEATYSSLISGEDAEIDWTLPALELWRKVRAYNPWPSCYTWWQGKRLKIHEAMPLRDTVEGAVGKVIAVEEPPRIGVITGHGILGLEQVQLEAKQKMAVDDFIRGRKDFIGSLLKRG